MGWGGVDGSGGARAWSWVPENRGEVGGALSRVGVRPLPAQTPPSPSPPPSPWEQPRRPRSGSALGAPGAGGQAGVRGGLSRGRGAERSGERGPERAQRSAAERIGRRARGAEEIAAAAGSVPVPVELSRVRGAPGGVPHDRGSRGGGGRGPSPEKEQRPRVRCALARSLAPVVRGAVRVPTPQIVHLRATSRELHAPAPLGSGQEGDRGPSWGSRGDSDVAPHPSRPPSPPQGAAM